MGFIASSRVRIPLSPPVLFFDYLLNKGLIIMVENNNIPPENNSVNVVISKKFDLDKVLIEIKFYNKNLFAVRKRR